MTSPSRHRAALLLALSTAAAGSCGPASPTQAEPAGGRPNLVLVTVDTLRADHLGAYGHELDCSPNLDRLAREGLLFERAQSQAPWTLPSLASVHTALYPSQHGAVATDRRLPDAPTLAGALRAAGYGTFGVVSHVYAGGRYGFERGFDRFVDDGRAVYAEVSSRLVTEAALELLDARPEPGPFFLWAHFFDPHFPYLSHPNYDFADGRPDLEALRQLAPEERPADGPPHATIVRHLQNVYDEEIAHTDHWIGALVAGAREHSQGEELVVVVTADHGEHFEERGIMGHGNDLYAQNVHVPLIVWGDLAPGLRGRRVPDAVETASIAGTLLDLAGARPEQIAGPSLLAVAAGLERAGPCFSELHHKNGEVRLLAVVLDGWKLVREPSSGAQELYHLELDPGERDDLARAPSPEAAAALERLSGELDRFAAGVGPTHQSAEVELDQRELDQLRRLGYTE